MSAPRWRRRRGERRRGPWCCRRCGEQLHVAGSSEIGVRILKCPTCGVMDRRLPHERRVLPPELARKAAPRSVAMRGVTLAAALLVLGIGQLLVPDPVGRGATLLFAVFLVLRGWR